MNQEQINRMLDVTRQHWQVQATGVQQKKRRPVSSRNVALLPASNALFKQKLRIIHESPESSFRLREAC